MTRAGRTTPSPPATGWEWEAGTLYRRRMRPWVSDAVMYAFSAVVFLILPVVFIVPALTRVADASWSWSVEMCRPARSGGMCTPAWLPVLLGAVLLVVWVVCVVDVVTKVLDQRRQTDVALSFDARTLSVSVPVTFRRRGSAFAVRWEDVASIEPHPRGRSRLHLRLLPGAEIIPARLSGRKIPVAAESLDVTMECGDPAADAATLQRFLDPAARRWLLSREDTFRVLDRAGV